MSFSYSSSFSSSSSIIGALVSYLRIWNPRSRIPHYASRVTLVTLATFVTIAPARAAEPERSVIQISAFIQQPVWDAPWRFEAVHHAGGTGFVIKGKRIMTNAHVVSWARQVIVHRYQDPHPYIANIDYVGHDCDLALLSVDDPRFFENLEPLDFGELPKVRSTVVTYGYPAGGEEISYTRGVVSRIQLEQYAHIGNRQFLTVQTDAAINPGNSGGPVIQDDRLKKLRWVLAHVPVITPDYLQKLKNLGGGVNVLGGWRWLTGDSINNGPPVRDIMASGIPVGMSSDGMQISTMSPWINLYYVVTGKNARGALINGGQTLGRNDAMRLYTAANGWFLHAEDKLGTIEEGKLADLVVLNADYFNAGAVPDESIRDLRSVLTVVGGKVVYDDLDGRSHDYWKAGFP